MMGTLGLGSEGVVTMWRDMMLKPYLRDKRVEYGHFNGMNWSSLGRI